MASILKLLLLSCSNVIFTRDPCLVRRFYCPIRRDAIVFLYQQSNTNNWDICVKFDFVDPRTNETCYSIGDERWTHTHTHTHTQKASAKANKRTKRSVYVIQNTSRLLTRTQNQPFRKVSLPHPTQGSSPTQYTIYTVTSSSL